MLTRYQSTPQKPWNVQRVWHLHRRAGFAANWSEIQRDLMEGPDAAVDRILRGAPIVSQNPSPPSPLPEYRARGESNNRFEQMSSAICDAAVGSGDINRLKAWWLYRMIFSPEPLTERLTLMWHNHFATSNVKVADVGLMRRQNAIFRRFSLASFELMLKQAAKDPALLIWLDADANRKEHPNENLAREIMELFTLGVDNYSENDVKEVARSLTGWSVNKGEFRYYDQYHDSGKKSIFGKSGNWNGDDVLQLLIEHTAVSQRLADRICELFMGEYGDGERQNHDSESRATLKNELAMGLRDHDLDVGWVAETVLRSNDFFSANILRNRVLGPVEFVIGAIRALELSDPPPSTLLLAEAIANLGQDLFYPPNVFGWPGGRSWLTSRSLIGRANFASSLVSGELHRSVKPFDATALARSHGFTTSEDIGQFFAQLLLGLSELPVAFNAYADKPNRLVVAILASPEAQLA